MCYHTGMTILDQIAQNIEREGGEDWIFARIADGEPEGAIAKDVGGRRNHLKQWAALNPERLARYRQAVKESADAHAEKAGEEYDQLRGYDYPPTREDIALAKEKSSYHRWLAEARERGSYAKSEAPVQVNVNLQALHLEALRAFPASSAPIEVIQATEVKQLEAGQCERFNEEPGE